MDKNRYVAQSKWTTEYSAWHGMKSRCNNPANERYHRYGGRGIKVCERWESFDNFLTDMGKSPSPKHSIDRIDNDGNYEPSNCAWSTKKEQANNKSNNRLVEYLGETLTLAEWSERLEMPYAMLQARLDRGWDVDKAFTQEAAPSRLVEYQGETLTLSEWSERLEMPRHMLDYRLNNGWDVEKAFTQQAGEEIGRKSAELHEGQEVGDLVLLHRDGHLGEAVAWRCLCKCGNEKRIRASHLKNMRVKSCGCGQGGKGIPKKRSA